MSNKCDLVVGGCSGFLCMISARSQAFKDGSTQRQVVDVLQQTVQRVSTLKMTPEVVAVFNKAKSHGYTTFMSAGSAVVSKITSLKSSKGAKGKAGAFLAFGAAATGTLLEMASNRGVVLLYQIFVYLPFHLILLVFNLFPGQGPCNLIELFSN